jgi:hypothetical protein
MSISIPILPRARKFGYVIWKSKQDFDLKMGLKGIKSADVIFEGENLGNKKIDWKYRRISLGWVRTRGISSGKNHFNISLNKDKKLAIKCQ